MPLPVVLTLYKEVYNDQVIFLLRITQGKDIVMRGIPTPEGWRFINQFYYREAMAIEMFGKPDSKPNVRDAIVNVFDFDSLHDDLSFVK